MRDGERLFLTRLFVLVAIERSNALHVLYQRRSQPNNAHRSPQLRTLLLEARFQFSFGGLALLSRLVFLNLPNDRVGIVFASETNFLVMLGGQSAPWIGLCRVLVFGVRIIGQSRLGELGGLTFLGFRFDPPPTVAGDRANETNLQPFLAGIVDGVYNVTNAWLFLCAIFCVVERLLAFELCFHADTPCLASDVKRANKLTTLFTGSILAGRWPRIKVPLMPSVS